MPKATSPTDRRTKAGRRHFNGLGVRRTQEAKIWKDLAYRAFQKQLASKEKDPPK